MLVSSVTFLNSDLTTAWHNKCHLCAAMILFLFNIKTKSTDTISLSKKVPKDKPKQALKTYFHFLSNIVKNFFSSVSPLFCFLLVIHFWNLITDSSYFGISRTHVLVPMEFRYMIFARNPKSKKFCFALLNFQKHICRS